MYKKLLIVCSLIIIASGGAHSCEKLPQKKNGFWESHQIEQIQHEMKEYLSTVSLVGVPQKNLEKHLLDTINKDIYDKNKFPVFHVLHDSVIDQFEEDKRHISASKKLQQLRDAHIDMIVEFKAKITSPN